MDTVAFSNQVGILEVTGDTITYNITAKEGYTVSAVLLNGELLAPSTYANGSPTLNKSYMRFNFKIIEKNIYV